MNALKTPLAVITLTGEECTEWLATHQGGYLTGIAIAIMVIYGVSVYYANQKKS